LNKRKPRQVNKRVASLIPALKLDEEVEHDKAAAPVKPMHDAPASPFSYGYVVERLNRSICDAQVSKNYNEAIRLQLLAWQMEDKEITPIEVARKAWLRPATEKTTL
jgi:hypothetical protein